MAHTCRNCGVAVTLHALVAEAMERFSVKPVTIATAMEPQKAKHVTVLEQLKIKNKKQEELL